MNQLLDETLELAAVDYDLKKKYDFRNIVIERHYQPDLPLLYCTPGEIQQVVLNLLNNSAQALHERNELNIAAKIVLNTRWVDNTLEIIVADNGPGMDQDTCRRVFEPFFTLLPNQLAWVPGLAFQFPTTSFTNNMAV